jgi:hypothetical protein
MNWSQPFAQNKMENYAEVVLVFRENARQHAAACKRESLREMKFDVLYHPAHSPDLRVSICLELSKGL